MFHTSADDNQMTLMDKKLDNSYVILHTSHTYRISQPIRCTVIFSLVILEKSDHECILILVIYWKETGSLHTKISNHNIIYSS